MIHERYMNEFRGMSVGDLNEVQSALDKSIENKKGEEIQALREEMTHKASVLGISAAELLGKKKNRVRKPIEPKYRIVSADGSTHEWSGRGLQPKVFRNYSKEELEARFRI